MASRYRHRAPNPPPWFVGRTSEMATAEALLARGPLAILVGASGAGKSACAFELVARRGPEAQSAAVYLAVPGDEPVEQVLTTLAAAIAGVRAPADADELGEEIVEAAEAGEAWILLDDLHHTDIEELGELLVRVRSFARRSKWLALSRVAPPQPELLDVIVRVDRLDDESLRELGRRYAPQISEDELERAVRGAAGSPFFLRRSLTDREAAESGDPMASLDRDARSALALVAEVAITVPAFLVAAHVGARTLEALVRSGLVESHAGRIRCHESVRAQLSGTAAADAVESMARTFAEQGDAEAAAEALRLFAASGSAAELVRLGRERGEEMIARGLAPRVWRTLRDDATPELRSLRLRCAAVLGNPTALSALEPAKHGGGLDWARTAFLKGDVDTALAAAAELAACDAAQGPSARLLAARCHLRRGDLDAAEAALAEDPGRDLGFAVRGARALLAAYRGDGGGVARVAGEAAVLLREEPDPSTFATLFACCEIAEALGVTGAFDDALRWARLARDRQEGDPVLSFIGRLALLVEARIAVQRGDLLHADAIASALLPYVRGPSVLRPAVREARAAVDFELGRALGLHDRLAMIAEEARSIDAPCASRAETLRDRLRIEEGGAHVPALTTERIDQGGLRLGPMELVALSRSALAGGRAAFALECAREAEARALRRELPVARCEAIRARLDAVAVLGLAEELAAAAELLASVAREVGSSRLVLEAGVHAAWKDPPRLEPIAAAPESLTANRRARALLGGAPPLDAVDALYVEAARRASGHAIETIGPRAEAWTIGWGLDEESQRVWLPDGRWLDLRGRSTPWALLWYLAERGGAASKEELTIGVWKEPSYHPGRHDARIHVAVRKLRQDLEDDPSRPRRLLTTEDGYALGRPVRRRVRITLNHACG